MLKRIISLLLAASVLLLLASCGDKKPPLEKLRIGIVKGGAQVERDVFDNMTSRLEEKGYQLTYVEFDSDEATRQALADKKVDLTCCTTFADFKAYDEAHPGTLKNLGAAYYFPYGIFLCGFEKEEQITDGATIAVPSEAKGQARALMLLDEAGYIRLKAGKTFDATVDDIEKNDRGFAVSAYPEKELPNRYKDFTSDLVVMSSQTAAAADYSLNKHAIAIDGMDSLSAKENAIVLLINKEEARSKQITSVEALFFSPLMYDLIDDSPNGIIVPAFEISPMKLAAPHSTDAGEALSEENTK